MNCHQFIGLAASRSKRFRSAVWSMIALAVTGCNGSSANRQPDFVVVDIVSVARALGRDEIIQQKLEDANALLNSQLTQISSTLQQQLKDEQSKIAESKNRADEATINNLTVQTELKLRQSQLLAKQKADQFRSKLLLEFREEVLMAAKDIAKNRQVLSVQIANNDLLWYDPSIDITGDVIKLMRASEQKAKPAKTEPDQKKSQTNSTSADKPAGNAEQVNQLNSLMDSLVNDENQSRAERGSDPGKKAGN